MERDAEERQAERIAQQKKTNLLVLSFCRREEPNIVRLGNQDIAISHTVFVIGGIKPLYLSEDKEKLDGWILRSIGPATISEGILIYQWNSEFPLIANVLAEDLNGVVPKLGDYVHVRKIAPHAYGCISLEIIKDGFCPEAN